jgi:hypothetical protein
MPDSFRDRIALLLWRDRDGYDPATGCVGDSQNISLRTRFRQFKSWFCKGLRNHWRFWITTTVAICALIAAIAPLYLNIAKPAQKMDASTKELLRECLKQSDCAVRIEIVRK